MSPSPAGLLEAMSRVAPLSRAASSPRVESSLSEVESMFAARAVSADPICASTFKDKLASMVARCWRASQCGARRNGR